VPGSVISDNLREDKSTVVLAQLPTLHVASLKEKEDLEEEEMCIFKQGYLTQI